MSDTIQSGKVTDILKLENELNRIQDLDVLLERILFEARRMMNADAGSIYIREGSELIIKYSQNDTMQRALPLGNKLIYSVFKIPINKKTISGYVATTGELINIPDAYTISKKKPYKFNPEYDIVSGYRTVSVLACPLMGTAGDIVGVIQVINSRDDGGGVRTFSKDDELFVTHFGNDISIALQRARMTRAIILRMIRMAELRDPKETGAHVNRVAGYATEIYERWAFHHGITEDQRNKNIDTLRMAAMLHDVGKVGISDTILKKPARFTPDEYNIIKQHAFIGACLFSDKQSEFDEMAMQIALRHHENWDGTGYPGRIDLATGEPLERRADGGVVGLVGEEIPFWGRIVSLADVYDALSSARVYKEAWTEANVFTEIRKCCGTKFDPELVEIFFEILPNIKQISERFASDH